MRGLSGWTLPAAAAVVFGLTLFWVYPSIDSITSPDTQINSERIIPVLEPGDEEPPANRSEDDTPKPVLLPASTETPPAETMEMATDPQASEAVEFVLQKPFAEAAVLPVRPVVPAAESPSYEPPPPENAPAFPQDDPAQILADPYTDETLLPVFPQSTPSDMPTGTEETSPQSQQPLSPDLPVDAGTPPQPPASLEETISSSDLPADSSPFAEDTADLE
jgi:hypothetical protein